VRSQYTLASCISFIVLVGDFLPEVLHATGKHTWLFDRWLVIVVVAALVLFPLSMLKTLNSLRYASVVGLFCSFWALLLLIIRVATHSRQSHTSERVTSDAWGALAIINVAYTLHYNGVCARACVRVCVWCEVVYAATPSVRVRRACVACTLHYNGVCVV
jgi:amino acid permease